jgi:hypothetical protein
MNILIYLIIAVAVISWTAIVNMHNRSILLISIKTAA